MVGQELITYIKQNLRDGFSEADIRQALLGAGWGATDVAEAFSTASSKPAPAAARPVQSMDILEKELTADEQAKKPAVAGVKVFSGLLPVLILLPALGIGGFLTYQRFFAGTGQAEQLVNSAMIEAEAGTRDRIRLENIEALQTALASFYAAHQVYPQTLEELTSSNYLPALPTDPVTGENYLYAPLGDPTLDYSLTFIMETPYGTESAGLYSVNPDIFIKAADIKTKDQTINGIILKTPSPDLAITDLSTQVFSTGDEASLTVTSPLGLAQVILLTDNLKLSDEHEPFSFAFTVPKTAGTYEVKIYGFAANGEILYQTTTLTVNP